MEYRKPEGVIGLYWVLEYRSILGIGVYEAYWVLEYRKPEGAIGVYWVLEYRSILGIGLLEAWVLEYRRPLKRASLTWSNQML